MRQKIDYIIDPMIEFGLNRIKPNVNQGSTFAQEFSTVQINLGRQCGHTQYIIRTATSNDCIVAIDYKNSHRIEQLVGELNPYHPTPVMSVDTLKVESFKTYNIIWVDVASCFTKDEIKRVYETFYHRCKLFALIG